MSFNHHSDKLLRPISTELYLKTYVIILNTIFVFRYVVMACTPARMVEHLLDSRLDSGSIDPALDDFLLTHVMFISTRHLVQELKKQYPFETTKFYFIFICKKIVV